MFGTPRKVRLPFIYEMKLFFKTVHSRSILETIRVKSSAVAVALCFLIGQCLELIKVILDNCQEIKSTGLSKKIKLSLRSLQASGIN